MSDDDSRPPGGNAPDDPAIVGRIGIFDISARLANDEPPIQRQPREWDGCQHRSVYVDSRARVVTCRHCNAACDPITVLLSFADYFARVRMDVEAINRWNAKRHDEHLQQWARSEARRLWDALNGREGFAHRERALIDVARLRQSTAEYERELKLKHRHHQFQHEARRDLKGDTARVHQIRELYLLVRMDREREETGWKASPSALVITPAALRSTPTPTVAPPPEPAE